MEVDKQNLTEEIKQGPSERKKVKKKKLCGVIRGAFPRGEGNEWDILPWVSIQKEDQKGPLG